MNAFQSAREVEFTAWQRLKPFVAEISDGRFVLVNKGPHARRLQEELGDIIANLSPDHAPGDNPFGPEGRLVSIEIKSEREERHGNLFLESWSNRNLEERQSHAERGSNPGWMFKTRADLLFYYFIEQDAGYCADIRERIAHYEGEGRHSLAAKARHRPAPQSGTLL